jgi:NifU-like protein
MWEYTDKVKDHFFNPRNVGEVDRPDGVGEVGSLACGDALKLTFKIDDKGVIVDARFKTFGCGSAIASASALTEIIKGMSIEEADKLTNQDIVDYLGGLPEEKMHCSVMGREALEAAIANYRGEKPPVEEGLMICRCFGVTDKTIERAIKENGLTTVEEVTHYTKAGGGCGSCVEEIQSIIDRIVKSTGGGVKWIKPKKKLTNLQKIKLIEETVQSEIAPMLQRDGGDIELVDVVGKLVIVALRGACAECAASNITIKEFVEAKLREFVDPEIEVEEAKL